MKTGFVSFNTAKGNFFDRQKVENAVERASMQALSRAGAFIRTAARSSLKYGRKPSPPGYPPTVHKTLARVKTSRKGERKTQSVSPLRDFLFFSYDRSSRSVVVGPVLLNGVGGSKTLSALEYGGSSVIANNGKQVTVTIRPRPFMRPALASALRDLADKWRGQVRG